MIFRKIFAALLTSLSALSASATVPPGPQNKHTDNTGCVIERLEDIRADLLALDAAKPDPPKEEVRQVQWYNWNNWNNWVNWPNWGNFWRNF